MNEQSLTKRADASKLWTAFRTIARWLFGRNNLPISLSFLALVSSVAVPFYFERRGLNGVSLTVEQVAGSLFNLGNRLTKKDEWYPPRQTSFVPREFGITINGKPYETVIVSRWILKNTGTKPLLPQDVEMPITLAVPEGTKLLVVKGWIWGRSSPEVQWEVNEDQTMAILKPVLLNPDDSVEVLVAHEFNPDDAESQRLSWSIRAAGLAHLEVVDLQEQWRRAQRSLNVYIYFEGIQIYVLVLIATVLFLVQLLLAAKRNRLLFPRWPAFVWTLAIMLSSLCTAEILAWLIYKDLWPAWRICSPLLGGHVLLLVLLVFAPNPLLKRTEQGQSA
jgi:hypothetical protein